MHRHAGDQGPKGPGGLGIHVRQELDPHDAIQIRLERDLRSEGAAGLAVEPGDATKDVVERY
jgi:hypothetical protein